MNKKEIKFEDALKKLEIIVEKLNSVDIELDESIKLFEEGIILSNICSLKLDEAKKRIQILKNSSDGGKILEDFHKNSK